VSLTPIGRPPPWPPLGAMRGRRPAPTLPCIDTTHARLEVLALALQAVARTLSAPQARQAADELRQGVGELLAEIGANLTPEADEAIAVEARGVLGALGC
jgi:hypothetical protein